MSSKNRRTTKKIARLVRMDVNHHFCQCRWRRSDSARQATASRILAAMKALGRTMNAAVRVRAIAAIDEQRRIMGREQLR